MQIIVFSLYRFRFQKTYKIQDKFNNLLNICPVTTIQRSIHSKLQNVQFISMNANIASFSLALLLLKTMKFRMIAQFSHSSFLFDSIFLFTQLRPYTFISLFSSSFNLIHCFECQFSVN